MASVFAAGLFIAATLFTPTRFVAGQATDAAPVQSAATEKATPAEEFFERVRQELQKHQTIKAEMNQIVSIGDQQFKIAGEYLSAGTKLKLHYTVQPDQGTEGEMLEVCDGTELSTMLKVMDSVTVTQRNVQQILAAAANADSRKSSEATISAELGMGGITTLLASLARSMSFDAKRVEENGEHSTTVIQGRWKKEALAKFPKERDDALPAFIPDLVQIHVDTRSLFPSRIIYLKKQPQNPYLKTAAVKKSVKPLLILEFKNVEFDGPVDEKAFVFLVPQGIIPTDVTKQYLERLAAPTAPAAPAQ